MPTNPPEGYRPVPPINIYANTQGHSAGQYAYGGGGGRPMSRRTPGLPSYRQAWEQNMSGIRDKYPSYEAYVADREQQKAQQAGGGPATNNMNQGGDVRGAEINNYFGWPGPGGGGRWDDPGFSGPPPQPENYDPPPRPWTDIPRPDDIYLDDLPRDGDGGGERSPNPPIPISAPELGALPDIVEKGAETAATGGMNWLLPIAGGILGGIGSVPAEPQFNRIEHYNYWDEHGRERYGKQWEESERDPYQDPTGYFRSAQKASLTAMNAAIDNDAQLQFAQAQAGGGQNLATTGSQRALSQMAPAMFGQTAQNLGTGYNIRNQSAGFREDFNQRGINDAYRWHIDRIDRGMHPEQTTGWGAVSHVLGGAAAGFGEGLNAASNLRHMDLIDDLFRPQGGEGTSGVQGSMDPQVTGEIQAPMPQMGQHASLGPSSSGPGPGSSSPGGTGTPGSAPPATLNRRSRFQSDPLGLHENAQIGNNPMLGTDNMDIRRDKHLTQEYMNSIGGYATKPYTASPLFDREGVGGHKSWLSGYRRPTQQTSAQSNTPRGMSYPLNNMQWGYNPGISNASPIQDQLSAFDRLQQRQAGSPNRKQKIKMPIF